jgi:hypothetical protein
LVGALVVTFGMVGLQPAIAAASTVGPRASFTADPATPVYHVVGKNYKLTWTETTGATGREVSEQAGPLDINGGCARTTEWRTTSVWRPATTSISRKLAKNSCYRWIVTVEGTAGQTNQAISPSVRTLSAWSGTYNLYRTGVFSSQRKWDYCVPAAIQMMFNIIRGESKTGLSGQTTYYKHARATGLQPLSIPGADPRGWAITLRDFGGGDYADVQSGSFGSALKKAVKRMRLTGKPAGLIVENGDHAWVLNGFEATADPATGSFSVVAVYVMGPWYPRPRDGLTLDKPPNSRYTTTKLKKKFTAYNDPFGSSKWSVWEGSWVTINP